MRVKRGVSAHAKHKKLLTLAKGYRTSYHTLIKRAKEAVWHAGQYAVEGRKKRAGDYRVLWISRINAGLGQYNIKYSEFISKLSKNKVLLNRKVLADLVINEPAAFKAVVEKVNK